MAKRKSTAERLAALERRAAEVRVRAIEVGELRLVDRNGRVRAVLEMGRLGPRLAMMHEDGTVALDLTLAADGPGVRLADEDGKTRVFLGATRGAARMGMADAEGSQRLFLGVNSLGKPTLTLYDREQRQIWTAQAPSTPPRRTSAAKKARGTGSEGKARGGTR